MHLKCWFGKGLRLDPVKSLGSCNRNVYECNHRHSANGAAAVEQAGMIFFVFVVLHLGPICRLPKV